MTIRNPSASHVKNGSDSLKRARDNIKQLRKRRAIAIKQDPSFVPEIDEIIAMVQRWIDELEVR